MTCKTCGDDHSCLDCLRVERSGVAMDKTVTIWLYAAGLSATRFDSVPFDSIRADGEVIKFKTNEGKIVESNLKYLAVED